MKTVLELVHGTKNDRNEKQVLWDSLIYPDIWNVIILTLGGSASGKKGLSNSEKTKDVAMEIIYSLITSLTSIIPDNLVVTSVVTTLVVILKSKSSSKSQRLHCSGVLLQLSKNESLRKEIATTSCISAVVFAMELTNSSETHRNIEDTFLTLSSDAITKEALCTAEVVKMLGGWLFAVEQHPNYNQESLCSILFHMSSLPSACELIVNDLYAMSGMLALLGSTQNPQCLVAVTLSLYNITCSAENIPHIMQHQTLLFSSLSEIIQERKDAAREYALGIVSNICSIQAYVPIVGKYDDILQVVRRIAAVDGQSVVEKEYCQKILHRITEIDIIP
jgi:hypothetical protein